MSADEVRIGEAVASLRARLEAGPVDEPAAFAHDFITAMLREGWRPRAPGLPSPSYAPPPADPTTQAEALAACRANVAAARALAVETTDTATNTVRVPGWRVHPDRPDSTEESA